MINVGFKFENLGDDLLTVEDIFVSIDPITGRSFEMVKMISSDGIFAYAERAVLNHQLGRSIFAA